MLDEKEIEKRMIEALEEGGRRTMDELAASSGIDRERIGKALQQLENEELVHHITLEGTPRFYVAGVALVTPEKRYKKIDANCPWCGEGGFVNHWALGAHKRRCKKKPVLGKPIYPKEVKPPLVLDSPSITTTQDATASWSIGQGIGPVVPSGGKEEEKKESAGKADQYGHIQCPHCGCRWKLALIITWINPTATLIECPFCRT